MAGSDSPRRNYNMTDADLCMFTSNLVNDLTRDLSLVGVFGITSQNISNLKDLGDAFEALPTDIELEIAVMDSTLTKNTKLAEIKESTRNLALRVEMKWGVDSPKYKGLMITGMNNIADNDLLFIARRVHRLLTSFFALLSPTGLTQDMLDDFAVLIDDFEEAKNLQHDNVVARADASKERVLAGNEIYDLVVKYCEIGKRVFVNTDPVKYNCYIIYQPGPGTLTAPQGLRFNFSNLAFYWEMVENASSYNLEASIDGTNFFEIYAATDLVCAYTPVQEGWMWYRVRARNANGFGPYSDVLKQGYYSGIFLPPPSNLAVELVSGTTNSVKFTWAEVPSATNYKISKSIVAVGDGVGASGYIGDSTETQYIETVDSGHRYYYHVAAENNNQNSPASGDVFIDVS
jgi:hypothetical protein